MESPACWAMPPSEARLERAKRALDNPPSEARGNFWVNSPKGPSGGAPLPSRGREKAEKGAENPFPSPKSSPRASESGRKSSTWTKNEHLDGVAGMLCGWGVGGVWPLPYSVGRRNALETWAAGPRWRKKGPSVCGWGPCSVCGWAALCLVVLVGVFALVDNHPPYAEQHADDDGASAEDEVAGSFHIKTLLSRFRGSARRSRVA